MMAYLICHALFHSLLYQRFQLLIYTLQTDDLLFVSSLQSIWSASSILAPALKLLCHLASFLAGLSIEFYANMRKFVHFLKVYNTPPPTPTATHTGRQSQPKLEMLSNDHRSLSLSVWVCHPLRQQCLASSWNARVIIFDNYRHSCGKLARGDVSPTFPLLLPPP